MAAAATSNDRENLVYIAKLAEQAERYDDMVDAMKSVAKIAVELTVEERKLLSVGYKNVITSRRASWRIVSSTERKEESRGNEQNVKRIKEYRQKLETELCNICSDAMAIIDKHFIPSSSSTSESTVFFYKMKGDVYRYLSKYKTSNDRKKAVDESMKAYQVATNLAESDLSRTHPVRLGLALDFSIFYYEIMNSPERACHLANKTLDEAISQLDLVSEESFKDIFPILNLLKDNLTLWATKIPNDRVEDGRKANGPGKATGKEDDAEVDCLVPCWAYLFARFLLYFRGKKII